MRERTILLFAGFLVVQNLAKVESARTKVKRHRPKPTENPENINSDLNAEYEDYYEDYKEETNGEFLKLFRK